MTYSKTLITEGIARILIPLTIPNSGESLERTRSRAPVFYNPVMVMNRDSSILVVGVLNRRLKRSLSVCEPMCGTGVRGIRFALETRGVERLLLGDMSYQAVKLAEENIKINGLNDKVKVRWIEANLLLALHSKPLARFDYVDIDPYGTPAPFIDTAVRATRRDGIVALTATDMAPLCGVNVRACLRKYGSRSIRTSYSHEIALRILAGAFIRSAAIHEVASNPVFGYYSDHYVRLYMGLGKGKKRVDTSLQEIGYILHCKECRNIHSLKVKLQEDSSYCPNCKSEIEISGPLWLGDLADIGFCTDMLEISNNSLISSNRRLINIIKMVREEVGFPPGFYILDELCSDLGISSKPIEPVIDRLKDSGYKATKTHANPRGLKTDASIGTIKRMILDVYT
jgi:tRNA (guanine26-N2/guanine27-N2)-dimethyltransferase